MFLLQFLFFGEWLCLQMYDMLLDIMSQLELGKPEERRKPHKRVNGIFWIILLNLGIYAADHVFQVVIDTPCFL